MIWPARVFLNLSGGLDSTACLYLALAAGVDVVLHHCRLASWEGRVHLEQRATLRILDWCERAGLPGRFTYLETAYDYGTVRRITLDAVIWSMQAAIILADQKRYGDVEAIVRTRHQDDVAHHAAAGHAGHFDSIDAIHTALVRTLTGREMPYLWPLLAMDKAAVLACLPADLRALCWYCRRPTGRLTPCGTCHTCQQVASARQEEPAA